MPYKHEHAARLKKPEKYERFRRENDKFGSGRDAIWGITKDGSSEVQAIRFDKEKYSVAEAKKWLKEHNHKWILFEKASEGTENMKLQTITFNLKGNVRHDRMEGREYLVVPMIMLTEGVHEGSNGPLYYPKEELEKIPAIWNHKPIVVYHPQINGVGVSACDPDILTSRKVGVIMNTKFEEGKLKAEAWLEESRITAVDNRIADSLEKKEMMELSTGLFTDNDEVEGEWNGEKYTAIARNYRPDHLALLPDQRGACSIADGAGLLRLNQEASKGDGLLAEAAKAFLNVFSKNAEMKTEGGVEYPSAAFAYVPDPQKPSTWKLRLWETPEDKETAAQVGRAIAAVGKGFRGQKVEIPADDISKVKAKIRAAWRKTHPDETAEDMPAVIRNEMSHSEIWQKLNDFLRETKFPNDDNIWVDEIFDEYIIYKKDGKLFKQDYNISSSDEVTFIKAPVEVERVTQFRTVTGEVINKKNRKESRMDKKKFIDDLIKNSSTKWEESDHEFLTGLEDAQLEKMEPVANDEPEPKPEDGDGKETPKEEPTDNEMTVEQYIQNAPEGMRDMLASGVMAHENEKNKFMKIITSNKKNRFTEDQLKAKSLGELQALAALCSEDKPKHPRAPLYSGLGEVAPVENEEKEDALVAPVMNFSTENK